VNLCVEIDRSRGVVRHSRVVPGSYRYFLALKVPRQRMLVLVVQVGCSDIKALWNNLLCEYTAAALVNYYLCKSINLSFRCGLRVWAAMGFDLDVYNGWAVWETCMCYINYFGKNTAFVRGKPRKRLSSWRVAGPSGRILTSN